MKKIIVYTIMLMAITSVIITSCTRQNEDQERAGNAVNNEAELKAQGEISIATGQKHIDEFSKQYAFALKAQPSNTTGKNQTIVNLALKFPFFKAFVAAVVKTGLAPTLSDASLSATVFAPTDFAFAQLPAPFNNAENISNITNQEQIDALKTILLYHVLGTQVKRNNIARGSSSAVTLKAAGAVNDNSIYISNVYGLIVLNGNSLVLATDLKASNGVVHVINKVLQFPNQNIAEVAIANPNFSSLVSALVKTNLAGVFLAPGDYTVFAPTNAAFAQLPVPFNSANNIAAITDNNQIASLSNILRYHVLTSRFFTIDLGFLSRFKTLADGPNNKLSTILGLESGGVKGDNNPSFAIISPGNILTTNGVIHAINKVLLPR